MPLAILHVSRESPVQEFAVAASRIYECLEVAEYQERESSNYRGGTYYRGAKGDATLDVSLEDDAGFRDYQYWVTVRIQFESTRPLEQTVEGIILRLLQCGFRVSRQDIWDPEGDERRIVRTVFSLKSGGHGDRVAIERKREVVSI